MSCIVHSKSLWTKRSHWATCYQSFVTCTRANNTHANTYAHVLSRTSIYAGFAQPTRIACSAWCAICKYIYTSERRKRKQVSHYFRYICIYYSYITQTRMRTHRCALNTHMHAQRKATPAHCVGGCLRITTRIMCATCIQGLSECTVIVQLEVLPLMKCSKIRLQTGSIYIYPMKTGKSLVSEIQWIKLYMLVVLI